MNLFAIMKNMDLSIGLQQFNLSNASIIKRWMPLRTWSSIKLPTKAYKERYNKKIRTRGKIVFRETFRLRGNEHILHCKWDYSFIPSRFVVKNGILFCEIPNNLFTLVLNCENRFSSILLPINLKLFDKDYFALGALQGEMLRSVRGKSKEYFCFTNSEGFILNRVLSLITKLNLPVPNLSYQVILNTRSLDKINDREYNSYWSECLSVPIENFVKLNQNKNYITQYSHGAVSVKYYSKPFRFFIQTFLENFIRYEVENKCGKSQQYARGLIAAEGSVNCAKNGSLNYICIGGSKDQDVKHYKALFNCLGIKTGCVIGAVSNGDAKKRGWKRGTGGYMIIQGFDNFIKFYNYDLIETPSKRLRFLIGLSNHQRFKPLQVYPKILSKMTSIQTEINH